MNIKNTIIEYIYYNKAFKLLQQQDIRYKIKNSFSVPLILYKIIHKSDDKYIIINLLKVAKYKIITELLVNNPDISFKNYIKH